MAVNGGKIAGSFMGKAAFFSGAAAKAALGVAVAGGLAFMGYRLLSGSDKEVEPAAQVVAATEKTMEQNDAEQFANQESAPTEEENFSNTSFSEGIPSFLTEDPVAANEDKSVNQMAEAGMGTSVVPEREASQQNRAISQQQPVAERADAASNRTVTAEKNVSDRAVVQVLCNTRSVKQVRVKTLKLIHNGTDVLNTVGQLNLHGLLNHTYT